VPTHRCPLRKGKPEPRKGDFAGWWSRRIDREHRLVCRSKGDVLEIALRRFHCGQ
jgi:toxin YoeB